MYIERQIGHIYDYLDYVKSQVSKTPSLSEAAAIPSKSWLFYSLCADTRCRMRSGDAVQFQLHTMVPLLPSVMRHWMDWYVHYIHVYQEVDTVIHSLNTYEVHTEPGKSLSLVSALVCRPNHFHVTLALLSEWPVVQHWVVHCLLPPCHGLWCGSHLLLQKITIRHRPHLHRR